MKATSFTTSRGSATRPNEGHAKRCGKSSWKVIALHTHNKASYGAVAQEALEMYKYAFQNQVDIIAGDGNQHMQFHSVKHHNERYAALGEACSDIANGIFNLLARGMIAQQTKDRLLQTESTCERLTATSFARTHHQKMWTACSHKSLSGEKQKIAKDDDKRSKPSLLNLPPSMIQISAPLTKSSRTGVATCQMRILNT